jgi:uncharacterized protein
MSNLYYSFNDFLKEKFGCRVHKLSLHAGFNCPNLDGTKDTKGCIFCDNESFSPYLREAKELSSLEDQITRGAGFAQKRFKAKKFIAYFQSYTNTHADVSLLKEKFSIIRKFPDIVGLSISTRPDCIDQDKIDMIRGFSRDYMVWIEYGLQTVHNKSLEFLNRNHTYKDFLKAIDITRGKGIFIGVHLILGIPGETDREIMQTAESLASLPVSGLKFHCLHVVKNTFLEDMYNKKMISLFSRSEYVRAVSRFLEITPSDRVILRLVSDTDNRYLSAPAWINDKHSLINEIEEELSKRGSYQGKASKQNQVKQFNL